MGLHDGGVADGALRVVRGYFAVGIEHTKNSVNVGTLWRTAGIFGAAFVFTVGARYRQQSSDTCKTWRHTPLFHFGDISDLMEHLPFECRLVGVELDEAAAPLATYKHPERAVYLLGAEDHGLSEEALERCYDIVVLPGEHSLNVSVAGSIVLYDRLTR